MSPAGLTSTEPYHAAGMVVARRTVPARSLPFTVADCRFLVAVDEQYAAHVVSIKGRLDAVAAALLLAAQERSRPCLSRVVDALLDDGVGGEGGASRAKEVAAMLDTGEESISSALRHARANLHSRLPPPGEPAPAPDSEAERAIIEQLATAYEAGDVACLLSLLTEDAVITAPLADGAYLGPAAAARVFAAIFAQDRADRLIDTRANGQPAFGVYVRDPATGVFRANGMLVVTLAGDRIRAMTRFDNSVIAKFGLPRRLPQADGFSARC